MRSVEQGGAAAAARRPPPRELVEAVQRNCDRADARRARERSLCTYLLGMREFYRWRTARAPAAGAAEVGAWIAERERYWDGLLDQGEAGFEALPLQDGIDPFDETAANRALEPGGWVYGGGIGRFGAPVFFLADRVALQRRDAVDVYLAGREYARGFDAPPAASRAQAILVRTDAFARWVRTRAEELGRRPGDHPFARALAHYGRQARAADSGRALEALIDGELEPLILHELGENKVGRLVGAEWERMLAAATQRRTELALRALRDVFADTLVTLPTLLQRGAAASIDFWFANLDGLRRSLAAGLLRAWDGATAAGRANALAVAVLQDSARCHEMATEAIMHWRRGGSAALDAWALEGLPPAQS